MSDHNPNFHQRRSIRLKGYDYSKAGLYFITICTQNRECLFGDIRAVVAVGTVGTPLSGCPNSSMDKGVPHQIMILNDAGKMIVKWYYELENKYPEICCHEMVVMPNHFHCIVEITDTNSQGAHVGAPRHGHPDDPITDPDNDPITDPDHDPITDPDHNSINETKYGPNNKKFGATIGDVVDWFKTMTTNEYIRGVKNQGWKRFDGKLWQRNYWEHIIRNDGSLDRIANYIIKNPSKWIDDQLNPDQKN